MTPSPAGGRSVSIGNVRSSRDFQLSELVNGDLLELQSGEVVELREIDPRRGGELVLDTDWQEVERTPLEDCRRMTQAQAAGPAGVKRVVRQAPKITD